KPREPDAIAAAGRITIAYWVPADTVVGAANTAEFHTCLPLKSAIVNVVLARSAPVGRPPDVARMLTVMRGAVLQNTQNRLRSTWLSEPERPAVNVWPVHCVFVLLLNFSPFAVYEVFCWSTVPPPPPPAPAASWTLPGVVVRSRFVATPAVKSAWVVS